MSITEFIDKLVDHALGLAAEVDDDLLRDVQVWLVANGVLQEVRAIPPCDQLKCLCQRQLVDLGTDASREVTCYRRTAAPEFVPNRVRGRVKWYSAPREYGFVVADDGDGRDIFLHRQYIGSMTPEQLVDGAPVSFTVQACKQGLRVTSILPAEGVAE